MVLTIARPAAAQEPAPTSSTAQDLYYEGSARFSAADYTGAIDSFTKALAAASRDQLPFKVRGAFLINLARAHAKAHQVDGEVRHLRIAKEIYERYLREAASAEEGDAPDKTEVESELKFVDNELAKAMAAKPAEPTPTAAPASAPPTDQAPPDQGKSRKGLAVGLLSAGGGLLAGGAGILAWGAMFGPRAEDQIEPQDEGSTAAEEFLDDEKKKGVTVMAVGGVIAAIGLAGLITGAVLLGKAKKQGRNVAWTGGGVRVVF